MQVSPLEEYGLRCAAQLARAGAYWDSQALRPLATVSASSLASVENLSVEYVSKIMHLLRNADIVGASRGVRGGFYLETEPSRLSLSRLMRPLQTSSYRKGDFCDHFTGQGDACCHLDECSIRPVWSVLSRYFEDILGKLTLADLTESEAELEEKVALIARTKNRQIQAKMSHSIGSIL